MSNADQVRNAAQAAASANAKNQRLALAIANTQEQMAAAKDLVENAEITASGEVIALITLAIATNWAGAQG